MKLPHVSKKAVLALMLSTPSIVGFSKHAIPTLIRLQPSKPEPADARVALDVNQVQPADGMTANFCPQGFWNADCRHIAVTADGLRISR